MYNKMGNTIKIRLPQTIDNVKISIQKISNLYLNSNYIIPIK
jgi:hypothetical protein